MVNYCFIGGDEDVSPGVNEGQTALCGEVVNDVCACMRVCVCVCVCVCVWVYVLYGVCVHEFATLCA
jgi:hypothetical protein